MKIKKQEDIKDCGLIVLQAFYKGYYKKWLNINILKKHANYSKEGISVVNLEKLGTKFGLKLESFQGDFNSLQKLKITKEFIILISRNGLNHFVIVTSKTEKGFNALDPIQGKIFIENKLMREYFLNCLITVDRIKDYEVPKNTWIMSNIWSFFCNKISLGIMLSSVINSFLLVLGSFYTKIIFDKVIKDESKSLLITIFVIFLLLVFFKISNNFFKKFFLKKLHLKIEENLFKNYLQSLKQIHLDQINKVSQNDLLRRMVLITNIANFLSNFLFALFSELILFIFGFLMLFQINLQLLLITTLGNIIVIFISIIYQKVINRHHKKLLSNNLEEFSEQLNLSKNVINLKRNSMAFFLQNNVFQKYYNKKRTEYNIFKLNNYHDLIINLITNIIPLVIFFWGTMLFLEKQILLGNILIFVAFFNFYLTPLKSFTDIILALPIFYNEYQQYSFIVHGEKEILPKAKLDLEKIETLWIKNFSYSFDKMENTFFVKELYIDQSIKIFGPNGAGKSTFLKSLALLNYHSGDYLINHVDKNQFSWEVIREKILYLSNDQQLMNGTIFSFITENNQKKVDQFVACFNEFKIELFLKKININLSSMIENNGSNLSSGQKQIIHILKLFTTKYDVIVLDEALENIDQESLVFLKESILDFQKNAIFIEVSHNKKFVNLGKEVDFAKL